MHGVTEKARTYSSGHIRRQRQAHAQADGYGRHRHLYLHPLMRRLAATLRSDRGSDDLGWLDYGCGKGGFLEQVRDLNLFTSIAGHDPAVDAFKAPPTGRYDLVTCLDVLDIVEAGFQDAVVADIAALTSGLAVFDCLTMPNPASTLRPRRPMFWMLMVQRHMRVIETNVEFPGMTGFERVVIVAAPR